MRKANQPFKLLLFLFLLFPQFCFAKEVIYQKDIPVPRFPALQVTTIFDDEDFLGYHTVVTEDMQMSDGKEIKIVYMSKITKERRQVLTQHLYSVFYALHMQRTGQLFSQNQANSTDSESDEEEIHDEIIGSLYSIPEGSE